ncbi:MAG: hypothetical protein QOJ69_26 [Actinomycetota bacterium]|jgi:hypothetical protein|nr:hypothetical protein [Actinomycetota bacterium]MEA2842355.1 hypothetical protein [Actinomycetota bacterium]
MPTVPAPVRHRRTATFVAAASTAVAVAVALSLSAVSPAWAVPADKPVVTVAPPIVKSSGGVTPDSWRTYVTMSVGGNNFTPGGNVYVTFQDLTAGTGAINGEWTKAGSGPCGVECINYGKISYKRTLNFAYGTVCGHVMRTWAWDQVKSPQAGYDWSYRDATVSC